MSGLSPTADRYLRLLQEVLTGWHDLDEEVGTRYFSSIPTSLEERRAIRRDGRDWPARAVTMIGFHRLQQFQASIVRAVGEDVPGDIIEAGVWRGGACILARACLLALGCTDRRVWLADSFSGLPPPEPGRFAADSGDKHFAESMLAVPEAEVAANFARFDLLDENVRFLSGWFSETLPIAPVERIAVLRLDADMYGSTWTALETLYPKVSPSGVVIVDDYGAVTGCRMAVDDYRARYGIEAPLQPIDWTGVYWRVP